MKLYKIEYHRVWEKTIEAGSRKEALENVEVDMSEEPDAEDYSYAIVKNRHGGGGSAKAVKEGGGS